MDIKYTRNTASEHMTANPCAMHLTAFAELCESGEIQLANDIDEYNDAVHDGFMSAGCAWVEPHSIFSKIHQHLSRSGRELPMAEAQMGFHLAGAELIEVSYESCNGGQKVLFTKKAGLPGRPRMMVLNIERVIMYLKENGIRCAIPCFENLFGGNPMASNPPIKTTISTLPPLLTVRQCSEYLCISPSLMYRLCHKKQIRHLHLGKTIRIPREAVAEFLNSALT